MVGFALPLCGCSPCFCLLSQNRCSCNLAIVALLVARGKCCTPLLRLWPGPYSREGGWGGSCFSEQHRCRKCIDTPCERLVQLARRPLSKALRVPGVSILNFSSLPLPLPAPSFVKPPNLFAGILADEVHRAIVYHGV